MYRVVFYDNDGEEVGRVAIDYPTEQEARDEAEVFNQRMKLQGGTFFALVQLTTGETV